MRGARSSLLLAVVTLPVFVAGCADPFAPPIDCGSFLEENEGREGSLVVTVTDGPGGPPLDDALVTVEAAGTCWQRSERGSTAEGGRASWTLPAWGHATVSVAADGRTPERAEDVPLASDGRSTQQTIAVYRTQLSATMQGSYAARPPGVLPVLGGDPAWQADPLPWTDGREAAEGYGARILRMDVRLAWTNTPTDVADLALGLGRAEGQADVVIDSAQDQGGAGAHEEAGSLSAEAMYRAGWSDASEILIGPLSLRPRAALTAGIPYEVTIAATFGAPRDANVPLGAWTTLTATATAATLALLWRRPRA